MKKYKYGIIGVIIIVLTSIFFTYNSQQVQAFDEDKCKDKDEIKDKNQCKEDVIKEKYNIQIEKDDDNNNTYTISIGANTKKYKNVEFQIVSINGVAPANKITLKGSQSKSLNISSNSAIVKLETHDDPDCGCVGTKLEFTSEGAPKDDEHDEVVYDDQPIKISQIDCDNFASKYAPKSFNWEYCNAINKAKNRNHEYDLGEFNSFSDANISVDNKLKCSDDPTPNTSLGENDETYYLEKNREYYYAYNKAENITAGYYEYHYAPGNFETEAVKCSVQCHESVVVEYGPPVASKAGLCFEYKVKVTSRVSCEANNPNKYKKKSGYCTPAPVCTNGNYYVRQAGPVEEFDACVQSCDGGKYTEKCSKKCYNKVYGTTDKTTAKNMDNSNLHIQDSMALLTDAEEKYTLKQCFERNKASDKYHKGCYYVNSKGKIKWDQEGDNVWKGAPGRWYKLYASKNYYEYDVDPNGFYRHRYADGSHCRDTCWWTGCSGNKYLNPLDAKLDAEENHKIYLEAKKSCEAAAKCTTKTATFTISVDYKTKNGEGKIEKHTIDFPYTTKDKLNSNKDKTIKGTAEDKGTTILGYAGCYKDHTIENFYQTEWSFPGSWLNSKTGVVSFEDKTKIPGWYHEKDKFCIPLNAENVNTKWWNWRLVEEAKKNPDSYFNTEKYEEECGDIISKSIYKSSTDSKDLDYNIRAETESFGYYGWKFNIKCFYALNNNPSNTGSEENKGKEQCYTGLNYRVRAINLEDMFPSTDGTKTNTAANPKATGRTPGFNWSDGATITSGKNINYANSPSVLIEQIQKEGNKIYSQTDYIDYEFVLTPETLRLISEDTADIAKAKGATGGYVSWTGEFDNGEKFGVVTYKSRLIHNVLRSSTIKTGIIGCNNDGPKRTCASSYEIATK